MPLSSPGIILFAENCPEKIKIARHLSGLITGMLPGS